MNIFIADEDSFSLESLTRQVRLLMPQAQIFPFLRVEDLIAQICRIPCDIALLDSCLRGAGCLAAARSIKDQNHNANIIFIIDGDCGTGEFSLPRAGGYLCKPITPDSLRRELFTLRNPLRPDSGALLQVQCFGRFEVFRQGVPVCFEQERAKEAFAYLIHKRGAACTARELCSALFEGAPFDTRQQNDLYTGLSSLKRTLAHVHASPALVWHFGSAAAAPAYLDCDYYRFLAKEPAAVNAYCGEYMSQYSWADFSVPYLDRCV